MKKFLIIAGVIVLVNIILLQMGISPFSIKFFLPDYYDIVTYSAPAWINDNTIVFIKEVQNCKVVTPWRIPYIIYSGAIRRISNKRILCKMDKNGSNKTQILELAKNFAPQRIVANKEVILLSDSIIYPDTIPDQIIAVNIDGSGYRVLCSGYSPVLSPDGEKVIYCNGTAMIINIDGSNKQQLGDAQWHSTPVWSKAGKSIVFYGNIRGTSRNEAWDMDINGNIHNKLNILSDDRKLLGSLNNGNIMLSEYKSGKVFVYDVETNTESAISYGGIYSPDESSYILGDIYIYSKLGAQISCLVSRKVTYGNGSRPRLQEVW